MKTKLLIAGTVALLFSISGFTKSDRITEKKEVFTLRYVKSIDVFRILKVVDSEFARAVAGISLEDNTITINPKHADLGKIRALISRLDHKPVVKKYSIVVTEVPEGKGRSEEEVVLQPTIYTNGGSPAIFHYPLENGKILNFYVEATEVQD